MQPQSKGVINQIMFAQYGKTGDDDGEDKYDNQTPKTNLDHITCNDFWGKGCHTGNS